MRIGLSTTTIEPAVNGGHLDGIGVYTTRLGEGFSGRGHLVEGRSFPSLLQPALKNHFVKGRPFPYPFQVMSAVALLSGGCFRSAPDVDVFHVTDYRVLPMRCPLVATLHDAIPLRHPEMANARLRGLKNFVQKSMARFADHVITLSQYTVPDLMEFYRIPESRISVVPCGVDSKWLEPVDAEAKKTVLKRRQLEPGYFLFVGTFQPRKNIERILAAYGRLPANLRKHRKLVLVGRGGWGCEALIESIRGSARNGQVVWLNDVNSMEELRFLYSGAGIFLFPSLYEGYGIPVLEAFASAVPVITSNTTSLPEVSGGAAVEINPESLDDLVSAMAWLATDEAERSRRIAAGVRRARGLTWNHTVEGTLKVYQKLL
ncbi:MAG: glycosyltransferase family 1 protein [Syntrophotaleaceae bacterium]